MYFFETASEEHIKKEKEKARALRRTNWWTGKVQREKKCQYCNASLSLSSATLDHIVPLSRGGKTSKGNVAVCCKECNTKKKYYTPVEWQSSQSSNSTQSSS